MTKSPLRPRVMFAPRAPAAIPRAKTGAKKTKATMVVTPPIGLKPGDEFNITNLGAAPVSIRIGGETAIVAPGDSLVPRTEFVGSRITPPLAARLRAKAEAEGVAVSEIVRRALEKECPEAVR